MIIIVRLGLRYIYFEYEIYIAKVKVSNLFESMDEEEILEVKPSKIKDSLSQAQINDALQAINNINMSGEEEEMIVFALQSFVFFCPIQTK